MNRSPAADLRHKSNFVVAKAAELAGQEEALVLGPDLIAAFHRLMEKPDVRDRGCVALIAIATALVSMGHHDPDVYIAGVRHVQMEGSYGPPIDAAAPLRGVCARGLVRMSHADALYHVVTLLAQQEIPAQVGAVRALSDLGNREAELLLRLYVLKGRLDSEVMGESFTALLAIAPHRSLTFVAEFLSGADAETIEAAALSVGASRLSGALAELTEAWRRHRIPALRRTILLSIAMLRNDDAVAFLVERLESDHGEGAAHALAALELYRSDDLLRVRIDEIVKRRKISLTT